MKRHPTAPAPAAGDPPGQATRPPPAAAAPDWPASPQVPTSLPASSYRRWRPWYLAGTWLLLMTPLTWWGLPDARHDRFLFAGGAPWRTEQYQYTQALEARRQRLAGADTDLNPIEARDRLIDLTATSDDRAEILRRFRLYSRQPDEMITFMALQRMRPRELDFDPRLFQYGGAWVYLVGAAVAFSSALGLTHLVPDAGFYLLHPAQFARFYAVARLVTLVFAAGMLLATWRLADRLTERPDGPPARRSSGWLAALILALAPVFIVGALDAKPHVPSACLVMLATTAALNYCCSGRRSAAVAMGLAAGGASGLVLTGVMTAVLWPMVVGLRRAALRRTAIDLLIAAALAATVYAATNPYVLINLLTRPEVLASNLSNSLAMYSVGRFPRGLLRVGQLLLEGLGPATLALGGIGLVWTARIACGRAALAASPALALLLLCASIGADKPAEFARFLVVPAALFSVGGAFVLDRLMRRAPVAGLAALGITLGTCGAPRYLESFVREVLGNASRDQAAAWLARHLEPDEPVGVVQAPAPFSLPPLDLARRRLLLMPPSPPPRMEAGDLPPWLVVVADGPQTWARAWWQAHYALVASFGAERPLTPIAWAHKPVFVYHLRARPGERVTAQRAGPQPASSLPADKLRGAPWPPQKAGSSLSARLLPHTWGGS